jgi:O-6-methylguanine DNA methyltransferase
MNQKHAFARKVQAIVRKIPKGQVQTYGEVAAAAGRPGAARAVGNVMAHNDDKTVPCHRVIRSDGKIGGYNGINGASKEKLLRAEGYTGKLVV